MMEVDNIYYWDMKFEKNGRCFGLAFDWNIFIHCYWVFETYCCFVYCNILGSILRYYWEILFIIRR